MKDTAQRRRYTEEDFLEAMNIAPEYVLRGLGLFDLHADGILDSYRGGGHFTVPSATDASLSYQVRVGLRPERDRCECTGSGAHHHCSHIVAARQVAKLSAICDGCGKRFWRRELTEVVTGDPRWAGELPVMYFEGDLLCWRCCESAA